MIYGGKDDLDARIGKRVELIELLVKENKLLWLLDILDGIMHTPIW